MVQDETSTFSCQMFRSTAGEGPAGAYIAASAGGNSMQSLTRVTSVPSFTQVCIIPDFLCYRKKTMCLEFTRKGFFRSFSANFFCSY